MAEVKKYKTTIMLSEDQKQKIEKKGLEPDDYVKYEAIQRMIPEIASFITLNKNHTVFDNGFYRYEASIILAQKDDEKEDSENE